MTPESGLALQEILMTPTLVETTPTEEIMESGTSKPLDISWYSSSYLGVDSKSTSKKKQPFKFDNTVDFYRKWSKLKWIKDLFVKN